MAKVTITIEDVPLSGVTPGLGCVGLHLNLEPGRPSFDERPVTHAEWVANEVFEWLTQRMQEDGGIRMKEVSAD